MSALLPSDSALGGSPTETPPMFQYVNEPTGNLLSRVAEVVTQQEQRADEAGDLDAFELLRDALALREVSRRLLVAESALRSAREQEDRDAELAFLLRVAAFALEDGSVMRQATPRLPEYVVLIDSAGRDVCDRGHRRAFERLFEYQDDAAAELAAEAAVASSSPETPNG